jgi:tetratricopeptide (TPR) repeat protein
MLVAQASSCEEDMDADIFAGMLSAVQNFVGDSLDTAGEQKSGLGRLEYGDMKILIEHGKHLFLTGVFSGGEHPDMKGTLKRTLQRIEEEHGASLEKWSGKVSEVEPVHREIMKLSEAKFLVRRGLEGVKLENERIRIADRVLDSLAGLCSQKPLALVLEDLHWADESSMAVLNHIARNTPNMLILILCTSRDSEGCSTGLESLREEAVPTEIRLEGITATGIAGIIDSHFPDNDFSSALADRLSMDCAGNPLFISELLRQMASESAVLYTDGRHMLAQEDYAIPASVGEIVERRLEGIDPESVALAEYASCIGREFPRAVLASMPTTKDTAAALGRLEKAGILVASNGNAGFSHALFRDAIYSSVSSIWKEKYHRSLGEYFESTVSETDSDAVYDMARHFSIAKDRARSLEYSIRAAERAEGAFAVDRALEFYGYAAEALVGAADFAAVGKRLAVLEKLGDLYAFSGSSQKASVHYSEAMGSVQAPEDRARLLRKTAGSHSSMAEYDKADEAIRNAFDAISGKETPEYGRLCLAKSEVHAAQGDFELATALCEEAISSFYSRPGTERDLAMALRYNGIISYKTGKLDRAIELYEKSLGLLDPQKDEDEHVQLLHNIGVVWIDKGEYAKAMEYFSRGEKTLERRDDRISLAKLRNSMGIVCWLTGKPEQARTYYLDCLATMRRAGKKAATAMLLNNVGVTYFAMGDIMRAEEYYMQSLAIRREIGDKSGIVQSLSNLGTLRSDLGDMDAAMGDIGECIALSREIGDNAMLATALLNKADTLTFLGRTDGVKELLDESLAMFIECGDAVTVVDVYYSMTNSHVLAGLQQEALETASKALECATALEIASQRELALAHLALGKAKRLAGEADAAMREFTRAADICSDISDRALLAKAKFEMGGICADRGIPEDAASSFSAALELFEAMSMKLWADKCRKALAGLTPQQ